MPSWRIAGFGVAVPADVGVEDAHVLGAVEREVMRVDVAVDLVAGAVVVRVADVVASLPLAIGMFWNSTCGTLISVAPI